MALFQGNVFSNILRFETQIYVSLPQDSRDDITRRTSIATKPKTLILLHGISDNAAGWIRRSQVELFAEEFGIALVIPEVQRSFYQDLQYGAQYFTYISEELPKLVESMFSLSTAREDLMIAGLSMGGYGAMRIALGYPDRFSVCGAFSPACDIKDIVANDNKYATIRDIGENFPREMDAAFGVPRIIPDKSDLFWLATQNIKKKEEIPKIYMSCGTKDLLYDMNVKLYKHLKVLRYDCTFEEWEGSHDWYFWNTSIKKFLNNVLTNK